MCLAHLLRELEYLTELDPKQQWSKDVASLFRQAIHERNTRPNEFIDKRTWLDKLDDLLKANLLHLRSNFERLRNGLAKCRDYIFNFLENPAIPPDNNASERGIRKLKIKQKVSGTFRSDNGADAFFSIHSIADTAWKTASRSCKLSIPSCRYRMVGCCMPTLLLNSYEVLKAFSCCLTPSAAQDIERKSDTRRRQMVVVGCRYG